MKITEDHIAVQKIAGKSGHDSPIIYILTKGGLHCFFTKSPSGEVTSLGTAPHKAIASFLAEQEDPKLEWNEDFILKGEAYEDALEKSERLNFEMLRKFIFTNDIPVIPELQKHEKTYFVYNTSSKDISILSKDEVEDGIKKRQLNRHLVIRPLDLSRKYSLLEDDQEFGKLYV